MKLWRIFQSVNDHYDTYDSAIVAAETEEEARMINPDGKWDENDPWSSWAKTPDQVKVELIGEAAPHIGAGVILASFNAG